MPESDEWTHACLFFRFISAYLKRLPPPPCFSAHPLSPAAQAPQTFSYQTVIRDMNWEPRANEYLNISISLLEDGPDNYPPKYREVHTSVLTNEIGLVNLAVGAGIQTSPHKLPSWEVNKLS